MIAWIALGLSVFNTGLWIGLLITIRKLFKALYPMFQSFGILQAQNLQNMPVYGIMAQAEEIGDAESET